MAGEIEPAYVADTYALIEILLGNVSYVPYLQSKLIATDFVLIELHSAVQRRYGLERANSEFNRNLPLRQAMPSETLRKASVLHYAHKKEGLSYADCAGWALAQDLGVPFLTGDKAFANKPGVAFVR